VSHGNLLLAIEASGSTPGVALARDGEVLAASYLEEGGANGEHLADCVREVLRTAAYGPESLDFLAAVRGPGSFTGIRIGLALSRGLALADGLPVVALGSLELVAIACGEQANGAVCTLLDAGRGKVYSAVFDVQGNELRELCATRCGPDQEVEQILATSGAATVVAGERSLLDRVGAAAPPVLRADWLPVPERRADWLARAAHRQLDRAAPACEAMPLYVAGVGARPNRNRVLLDPDRG